jgi:hypothetical protein
VCLVMFPEWSGLTREQSSLLSYFSGRFFRRPAFKFPANPNSDQFSEHLGWFKMGQNPWGKVLKCMEL